MALSGARKKLSVNLHQRLRQLFPFGRLLWLVKVQRAVHANPVQLAVSLMIGSLSERLLCPMKGAVVRHPLATSWPTVDVRLEQRLDPIGSEKAASA